MTAKGTKAYMFDALNRIAGEPKGYVKIAGCGNGGRRLIALDVSRQMGLGKSKQ